MAPLRRVPWYSSLEWLDVFNGVFSTNLDQNKSALQRISLWELKSTRVPVPVTCTRFLLEASLADSENNRSTNELQMLYGLAIVRFVNEHVDLEQKKLYAQSIGVAARNLGIPSEIVDCRHRITHQDMPTVELLRHTASLCFNYLSDAYWKPQAELIQSRITTMAHSKHLVSGLVALLQDLEELSPPEDMERSLRSLLNQFPEKKSSTSIRMLLQYAAIVTGLKQKDTMRVLKRLKMPEVLSEPSFVAATAWCKNLRDLIPKCLSFVETLLHSCPHENVTLSFLKDLVLVVYDPDLNSAAVLIVFWILSHGSPNLTYRLISRIIRSIVPSVDHGFSWSQHQHLFTADDSSRCSDYKLFEQSNQHFQDGILPSFMNGEESDECFHCFDTESFSLWLRASDVPLEDEELLKSDLLKNSNYQKRLLSWLRCLLLLPSSMTLKNDVESSSPLPDSINLLLHLFCDPHIDGILLSHHTSTTATTSSKHLSSPLNPSFTVKDIFCQRLMSSLNMTHSRVLASCRACLNPIARTALHCFVLSSTPVPKETDQGLRHLLRLFKDAEIKTLSSSSVSATSYRLLEWIHNRLLHTTNNYSRRQVLQRLLPSFERRQAYDSTSNGSLLDEFSSIFLSFQNNLADSQQTRSALASLRERASTNRREDDLVRCIDQNDMPWTHPGTLPISTTSITFSNDSVSIPSKNKLLSSQEYHGVLSIVDMFPMSGGLSQTQSALLQQDDIIRSEHIHQVTIGQKRCFSTFVQQSKNEQEENEDNTCPAIIHPKRLKCHSTDTTYLQEAHIAQPHTTISYPMTVYVPSAISDLDQSLINQHNYNINESSISSSYEKDEDMIQHQSSHSSSLMFD